MDMPILVAIIGGVLTLVNTIVGFVLTNLSKSQGLIQAALTQNQSDIRVHAVQLTHLAETLENHTENDRLAFDQVRDQQREHHQENQKTLQSIQSTLHQLPKRKSDPRP